MPSKVMGKVTKHIEDGDWHKFTINRLELKSRFEETYGGLEQGMTVEAEYTEQKNGNYTNRFLGKWKEIEDDGKGEGTINDVAERSGSKVDPDVLEAKDRAIHMESAFKSAAEYFKALPPEKVNFKDLRECARLIYADIQKAHDNVAFVKAE